MHQIVRDKLYNFTVKMKKLFRPHRGVARTVIALLCEPSSQPASQSSPKFSPYVSHPRHFHVEVCHRERWRPPTPLGTCRHHAAFKASLAFEACPPGHHRPRRLAWIGMLVASEKGHAVSHALSTPFDGFSPCSSCGSRCSLPVSRPCSNSGTAQGGQRHGAWSGSAVCRALPNGEGGAFCTDCRRRLAVIGET